jgi:uncharacterized paraquat-inducible protein A
MHPRNRIAIALAIGSLILLWPGLVEPALTIRASVEMFGTPRELSNETRSVLGAVKSLHESGNDFVAGLILCFSVAIPLLKAALLIPICTARDSSQRVRIARFVKAISKWSMADVFAVGMLIALLAAKGTANLSADAGAGFYYFAAYCLVSNAAFQFLRIDDVGDS